MGLGGAFWRAQTCVNQLSTCGNAFEVRSTLRSGQGDSAAFRRSAHPKFSERHPEVADEALLIPTPPMENGKERSPPCQRTIDIQSDPTVKPAIVRAHVNCASCSVAVIDDSGAADKDAKPPKCHPHASGTA